MYIVARVSNVACESFLLVAVGSFLVYSDTHIWPPPQQQNIYYLLWSNFFGISLVSKSQEKNRRGISISIINFKSLLYIYVHTSRRTFKEKTLEDIMDIVALSPLMLCSVMLSSSCVTLGKYTCKQSGL